MTSIEDLANEQRDTDPIAAAEYLATILDLPSVGLEVRGGRIVGSDMNATAYLYLVDDARQITLTFESLRDFITPMKLTGQLALHTHATPKISQQAAARALAYLSILAEHQQTVTADQISAEWGISFLQRATPFDVAMRDQGQRWAAFKHIEDIDRNLDVEHRQFARSVVVLVDPEDGFRYVRTGWFREHVRQEDGLASPQEIAQRMERVGWRRRGKEGRIKATAPGRVGQLVWSFYVVAEGWEAAAWTETEGDDR